MTNIVQNNCNNLVSTASGVFLRAAPPTGSEEPHAGGAVIASGGCDNAPGNGGCGADVRAVRMLAGRPDSDSAHGNARAHGEPTRFERSDAGPAFAAAGE